jgi:hypothetical protein
MLNINNNATISGTGDITNNARGTINIIGSGTTALSLGRNIINNGIFKHNFKYNLF